jgi:intracellular multiplication protein IcmL
MAFQQTQDKYMPRDNHFYRDYYHYFIYGLMGAILLTFLTVGIVLYQIVHRPWPAFTARQVTGEEMLLTPFEEPNLLSDTLLRWASKAASTAYTFDFVNYEKEIIRVRPYFTDAGWADFRSAISGVLTTIVQNQLFVTGVVSGAPIISNQGPLPGKGYVWRVQIPFLVTYQSANTTTAAYYIVVVSIIRVPTSSNPQGIGIDQFIMANPNG